MRNVADHFVSVNMYKFLTVVKTRLLKILENKLKLIKIFSQKLCFVTL